MEYNKNIWIWVFVAVALLFLFGSFGNGSYGMMGSGGMLNMMGGGMMGFGFLFMLLFWGIVIWLGITFINAAQSTESEDDALTILKKRYASGEITKKEFESMKKEVR